MRKEALLELVPSDRKIVFFTLFRIGHLSRLYSTKDKTLLQNNCFSLLFYENVHQFIELYSSLKS